MKLESILTVIIVIILINTIGIPQEEEEPKPTGGVMEQQIHDKPLPELFSTPKRLIFGIENWLNEEIVKRTFEYDRKHYIVGWKSFNKNGDLIEKSILKYDNLGYLKEWASYNHENKLIFRRKYKYDKAGYLIEWGKEITEEEAPESENSDE